MESLLLLNLIKTVVTRSRNLKEFKKAKSLSKQMIQKQKLKLSQIKGLNGLTKLQSSTSTFKQVLLDMQSNA